MFNTSDYNHCTIFLIEIVLNFIYIYQNSGYLLANFGDMFVKSYLPVHMQSKVFYMCDESCRVVVYCAQCKVS